MSFATKLAELRIETSVDWDAGEARKSSAIPSARWDELEAMVNAINTALPGLTDPHPSADSGGNTYLRWSAVGAMVDVEVDWRSGTMYCTSRCGERTSSEVASVEEIIEVLRKNKLVELALLG